MSVIAIITCALILLGFLEDYLHRRLLAKIPIRILVNGTRGKTTVTRMIASTLNKAGMKTFAKTTGSDARRILPDGTEASYRRRGAVNLMEQLPFVRLAVKGGAEAIVVECMALRAENQHLMAEKLVCPHYVVMTNAFVDHMDEIGKTQEETVRTLALSIPKRAILIGNDPRFEEYHPHMMLPMQSVDMTPFEACPFAVFEENLQLICVLAKQLEIPYEKIVQGVLHTQPDIGMLKSFKARGVTVINAFAVNDAQSFANCIHEWGLQGDYALLFNHRKDRMYRIEAFAQVIRDGAYKPKSLGVIGQNKAWAANYLAHALGDSCTPIGEPLDWLDGLHRAGIDRLICAGNIKGEGRIFLEMLMRETLTDV